jgi:hypothetical protein
LHLQPHTSAAAAAAAAAARQRALKTLLSVSSDLHGFLCLQELVCCQLPLNKHTRC